MIVCQNIEKRFNQQPVLTNINLHFKSGCVHVLLGKSGSGKSTLLNILTQLTPASFGTLSINDTTIHFPLSKQAKALSHSPVCLVFQQNNLWPHMDILKNLCLAPIKVLKLAKATVEQQALAWLEQFGLVDKAHAMPHQLSGGQQQRCALIRCLMMPYQAIALDEPTAALDPRSTQDVANALIQLKKQNKLLIVSTHDLEFAHSIADYVHYIEHGTVVESGSADCLQHPQTQALKYYLNQTGDSI
jgi:ABC-type polar amino acid transport system ATPase subunit